MKTSRKAEGGRRKASRVAWAIKSRGGWLCEITGTRGETIKNFLGSGANRPWRWWKRKYGLRAVKVEIREQ